MISIIVFPGSNCDRDLKVAIERKTNLKAEYVWHKTTHIKKTKIILIPGGFSFGDHLRAGVLASHSPAINEVTRHSQRGVPVVGICNGFQVLTECGLLPGVLLKNKIPKFLCKVVKLKVNNQTPFTKKYKNNQILEFPIAHSQGNYFISNNELERIKENQQIVFKYCDEEGKTNKLSNPNGSILNIAGLINCHKNVIGLMPHPERAIGLRNLNDGTLFFKSFEELL